MQPSKIISGFIALVLASGFTIHAYGQMFEEVAVASGVVYVGQSWGGAWGDFNGDGWPDLWASNHGTEPHLLINQQNGQFINIAQQVLPADVWSDFLVLGGYDAHGSVWIDIDRDGDQDLFQATDGGVRRQPDHLYLNDHGKSFSAEVGLAANADGTGNNSTMPLPYDYNQDGLPDLIIPGSLVLAGAQALRFLQQVPGATLQFSNETSTVFPAMLATGGSSATVSDFDADNLFEVGVGSTPYSLRVYENSGGLFNDITQELGLGTYKNRVDVVVADLDGDLDDDVFMVNGEALVDVVQPSDTVIEAGISVRQVERGFTFQAAGNVEIGFYPAFQANLNDIYVGASGYRPPSTVFMLDPTDTANHGIMPHTPGEIRGYFAGYDPIEEVWTVVMSSVSYITRNIVVNADNPISNLSLILVAPTDLIPPQDVLMMNSNGVLDNQTIARGFDVPSSGRNIGNGDFDNDGDLDLYIVSTGRAENKPNYLYLNDGSGNFTSVISHGAEGGSEGRGDAVAVADYDQDGFLDMFVTNGKSKSPFELDGVYALYHNLGNANHWLQLDLRGTDSSPNAVGAIIHLTAGGVTQRRMANAGVHYRAQDHQRIHFGLGANTTADSIQITWPSGQIQTLNAVAADQILRVIEPSINDPDGDGIVSAVDNCTMVANPGQQDGDADGYGNICDADFNNDGICNFGDLAIFSNVFLSADPVVDMDSDGTVNFADLVHFIDSFLQAPGPSGQNSQ